MIYIQLYEYMRGNDNHEMKYLLCDNMLES